MNSGITRKLKQKPLSTYIPPIIIILFFAPFEYYLSEHIFTWSSSHHVHREGMLAMLFLPLTFISLNRWLGGISLALYAFFLGFFLLMIHQIGEITAWNLMAVAGTSHAEALSVLSANKIAAVFGAFLLVAFFYIGFKFSHSKPVLLILSILWSFSFCYPNWCENIAHTKGKNLVLDKTLLGRLFRFTQVFPSMPSLLAFMGYEKFFFKPYPVTKHLATDPMILGLTEHRAKNIIFVIGESATAKRHGFYQASLPTTPLLSSLITQNKAEAISNAHSVANVTELALPQMLSFQSPDHPEKLFNRKNLIELAKEAGYLSYWIGNQYCDGPYGANYDFLSRYADVTIRPEYRHTALPELKNVIENTPLDRGDDLQLLSPFHKVLQDRQDKPKFIILHLVGSHISYADKYDAEDKEALPDSSDYDRSIHHTDRVLEKIISEANETLGKKFLLFYSSDHGEDIRSGGGHGLLRGDISQYKIPVLLAWGDPKQGHDYIKRIESLRTPKKLFSQSMEKILLLEMMGYKIDPEIIKIIAGKDRVLHISGEIFSYEDVPTQKWSGSPLPADLQLP